MTAQSSTVLKTYFETGDIPTQSQFADLIDSFQNIIDNNMLEGYQLVTSTATPPTQGNATPITNLNVYVTADNSGGNGLLLPPATVGMVVNVFKMTQYALSIFPSSGQQMLGLALNAPFVMKGSGGVILKCFVAGTWNAIGFSYTGFRANNSYASYSWNSHTTATTISVAGTMYLANIPSGSTQIPQWSDITSNSAGRLTFNNVGKNYYRISASFTIYNTRTSTNDDYTFAFFKNGSVDTTTYQKRMLNGQTSASYNYETISIDAIMLLGDGDYIELYVANDSSNASAGYPILNCGNITAQLLNS